MPRWRQTGRVAICTHWVSKVPRYPMYDSLQYQYCWFCCELHSPQPIAGTIYMPSYSYACKAAYVRGSAWHNPRAQLTSPFARNSSPSWNSGGMGTWPGSQSRFPCIPQRPRLPAGPKRLLAGQQIRPRLGLTRWRPMKKEWGGGGLAGQMA